MLRNRYSFVFAAVGVLALVASGCSNSSKTSSGSSNSNTATTVAGNPFANLQKIAAPNPCVNDPGETNSEIKIGMIVPQTGPQAASFGDAINGMKARIA